MMNTPLKFASDARSNLQLERSDYRADYEDMAVRTLRSIARHKTFIASLVGAALALASIALLLMPRKYSAEALIYPNLFSREQEKVVALASVDASSIVTSEARLIRSDAILRAVAQRLGLDQNAATSHDWPSQVLDWVRAMLLPETRNHTPFDRAVAMLRNKVVIMNDPRSYLISVSFTASSADEAARVVNAFGIEYFRDKSVKRQLGAVNAAEAELWRQLAIYGQKHPKVLQAADGLEAARATLKAVSLEGGGQDAIVTDDSVELAIPNQTPTSPRGIVILGLSFMLALLTGTGLAVWRDRRDLKYKNIAAPP